MAKILIVDDADSMRLQLSRDLSDRGYEVLQANDGQQGVDIGTREKIDMVITDFNMPKLDGLSMCEHIRNDTQNGQVPILLMTAQMNEDIKARGKQIGITALLLKPYNKERLLMAMDKLCPL